MDNVKENESQEITDRNKNDRRKSESNEYDRDGRKELYTLSPKIPACDPPEPEELIKALQDIENAASSDGVVREKISQLPTEVTDVSMISKILGTDFPVT